MTPHHNFSHVLPDTERLRVLHCFLCKASSDHRIGPHHISVYLALYHHFLAAEQVQPMMLFSREIHPLAKVSPRVCYKCLGELRDWRYIQYVSSFNPEKGSAIVLSTDVS